MAEADAPKVLEGLTSQALNTTRSIASIATVHGVPVTFSLRDKVSEGCNMLMEYCVFALTKLSKYSRGYNLRRFCRCPTIETGGSGNSSNSGLDKAVHG